MIFTLDFECTSWV